VAEGEIFGLLGPNRAGRTTTVESIVGLRVPDAGTIRMLGLDPLVDHAALRERVGVQLQASAQPPKLRAEEALRPYASFYQHPDDPQWLMETLGLSDKRETFFRDLSGGQKQRLSVALALIGRPTIAVLDELTTGLDPPFSTSWAGHPRAKRGMSPSPSFRTACWSRRTRSWPLRWTASSKPPKSTH
jgi:ABC-2 type transport system ATP-binding protein